jgi:hypothetical protein
MGSEIPASPKDVGIIPFNWGFNADLPLLENSNRDGV